MLEKLKALGFSEYEAKAYLALLNLGEATGYEVAKNSGIPRSMIYQTLNKLIEKGAVQKIQGEPVKYLAEPPPEYLERLKEEFSLKISEAKKALEALTPPGAKERVIHLNGEQIAGRIREMLQKATKNIKLLASMAMVLPYQELLENARQRQVAVELTLIGKGEELQEFDPVILTPEKTVLKKRGSLGFQLIIDDDELLLAEEGGENETIGIWTRHPVVVHLAEHHFFHHHDLPKLFNAFLSEIEPEVKEHYWKKIKELQQKLEL
ncbi:TrmB family transcriptional regulator [Carboxydothermus hydrogenoformans]|uniref:Putative transcriptional regulator n=1 Tax=Carboxydothermus hydrogenoformans (strain ATCC BAA-161 / DSM 6008 / Z-2901) TaxID=246194 RepID=Q3AAZ9_CARHZ|nr:helix-turn-helix domain-containing protein [Carboxydothermus hydrogenoformans]ABB15587.1 putative transcriptional regulator [Carboxydothermus hydrogenoformans Z-2901]